jgi:hypothetical protein
MPTYEEGCFTIDDGKCDMCGVTKRTTTGGWETPHTRMCWAIQLCDTHGQGHWSYYGVPYRLRK